MTVSRRHFLTAAAALALPCSAGAAGPADSPARVRLVDGGSRDGHRLAGIEIALAPGFKTYWRSPGDSGLAPRFDWSASANLASAEVLWPAPERLTDAGGTVNGYKSSVLLPVRVEAANGAAPVQLALTLDFGVCRELCIPVEVKASLDLALSSGEPPQAVAAALARVPEPVPLGARGNLAVVEVAPMSGSKPARIAVLVRTPAGDASVLFAEGPDNWFLDSAMPAVVVSSEGVLPGGPSVLRRHVIEIVERPAAVSGPVPVLLTLVAGNRAIETQVSLDAAKLAL